MPEGLEALRGECLRISTVVLALGEEPFALPTRLPAWNVKQLLGHLYRGVDRLNAGLDALPPAEADADSVSYWRRFDSQAGAAGVAERGIEVAARFETGHELAEAWDEMWRGVVQRVSLQDGSRRIVTFQPILTLDEYVKTRVLEVTVHGMDLAVALGRHVWATTPALDVTSAILAALLGTRPPRGLDWDDVAFIEKGTGRRPLDARDREMLGAMADRFPLLS
ncbi:MAG TPA: maleylpyruvate isomerase family mycothiol-dependent enzyme [Actinomycetota bacterium]|jgi:uncharacterized protein (TIGR03083 family)